MKEQKSIKSESKRLDKCVFFLAVAEAKENSDIFGVNERAKNRELADGDGWEQPNRGGKERLRKFLGCFVLF